MITNSDITIFNRYADRGLKKIVYVPHHIKAVWLHKTMSSNAVDGGVVGSDSYKIRIPFNQCAGFVDSSTFKKLAETGSNWTVQEGDLFICGKWTGGAVHGIEEIKQKTGATVGKVLNHTENFIGASKHIRIGGGS